MSQEIRTRFWTRIPGVDSDKSDDDINSVIYLHHQYMSIFK